MANNENRRRVLITGATGDMGTMLWRRLREDYDLVAHGRTPNDPEQAGDLRSGDLEDLDEMRALMEGVDTVVHMAGASAPESTWDDVLGANIVGTRNVLEAARQEGVRRVVFASTNHVLGMYDRAGEWPVNPQHHPRPDSLYGVSKVFGEALGRFYHDEHGLEFIALRIGWSTDDPNDSDEEILHAMWLSDDDAEQVVRCAIEAPVTFGIYYAISDNPNRRWDITNTLVDLGYRPRDSWADRAPGPEDVVPGGHPVRDSWPEGS